MRHTGSVAPMGRVTDFPLFSMVPFTLGVTGAVPPRWLAAKLVPRLILIVPGLSVAFTCTTVMCFVTFG